MAEWSNAAVLKTVESQDSGGSNPSLSAYRAPNNGAFFLGITCLLVLCIGKNMELTRFSGLILPLRNITNT